MRAVLVVVGILVGGLALREVARAEPAVTVRVIVNPRNAVARVSKRLILDAFLKKRTLWDDDHAIQPVDLAQSSSVRGKFSHDLLGRDVSSVRNYWAQLVFSGRGIPPPELANDADVVKYVAAHSGAIGYVSGAAELAGVKVIEVE